VVRPAVHPVHGGLAVTAVHDQRIALGRCRSCEDRRGQALAMVAAHPAAVVRLGGPPEELAEGALTALALLDRPVPDRLSDDEVRLLLRHLGPLGSGLAWAVCAVPDRADPYAFAHVRESDRVRLRNAYAEALRQRVALTAPPVRLVPPAGSGEGFAVTGGCLLCGVAHVDLPAAQVLRLGGREAAQRAVWTPLATSPGSLGAPASPEKISGYLCPACARLYSEVRVVGPTLRERAYLDHLRAVDPQEAKRFRAELADAPEVPGWGALAYVSRYARKPAPSPNAQPWDHLSR
jgi:hypothetical protein